MGAVHPGDLFRDLSQPAVAFGELLTRPRDRLLALAEVLAQGGHRIVLDVLDQQRPLGQLAIAVGELRAQAGQRGLALGALRQLAIQPRKLVDVLGQPPVAVGKVLTETGHRLVLDVFDQRAQVDGARFVLGGTCRKLLVQARQLGLELGHSARVGVGSSPSLAAASLSASSRFRSSRCSRNVATVTSCSATFASRSATTA